MEPAADTSTSTEVISAVIEDYDFDMAQTVLNHDRLDSKIVETVDKFYGGNHWQDGSGWIGPPPSSTNPDAQAINEKLRIAFISNNIVKEIVDREVRAVTGMQPDFFLTVKRALKKIPRKIIKKVPDPAQPGQMMNDPSGAEIDDPSGAMVDEPLKTEEQALIDEAMSALIYWWDKQKVLKALTKAVRSKVKHSRGYLRIFVPPDRIGEDGRLPARDLQSALMSIFIETPKVSDANIVIDPMSMLPIAVTKYEVNGETVFEISGYENVDEVAQQGVDPAAMKTVIRTVARDDSNKDLNTDSEPFELLGNLTLYQLQGDALITEQILQAQKGVNLSLTMGAHNQVEAGFSERTFLNVELDTLKVPDPMSPTGTREVPKPLARGATASAALVGIQTGEDAQGNPIYATPGVVYHEPAPMTTFSDGKSLYKTCILEEAHQLHAKMSDDASSSGEARITALQDFVIHLGDSKEVTDSAGVWAIETALSMAADWAGTPGKFKDLRVNFDSKIYIGRISPDEKRVLQDEVAKKLRSRKSYMIATGTQDPEGELAQIKAEEEMLPPPAKPVAVPPKPGESGGT
jgi:hypothetical protein